MTNYLHSIFIYVTATTVVLGLAGLAGLAGQLLADLAMARRRRAAELAQDLRRKCVLAAMPAMWPESVEDRPWL